MKTAVTILFFSAFYGVAASQDLITVGEKQVIQSNVLGESRQLLIYKPEKNARALPLVLVFDGESLFLPVVSAMRFMNYSLEIPIMPEAIVVGIPNTDRNRDMPIPQVYGDTGEKNFSKFIKDELLPSLEKKYALNGEVILIGHSQGGLFVSYLMSEDPAAFSMAIALDAPLNVDTKTSSVKQKLEDILKKSQVVKYVSMETAYGWGKDWNTVASLPNTFRGEYSGETHESMPYKSVYDGLRFLFQDFASKKRELTLTELVVRYDQFSKQRGHTYEAPLQTLLASANRKIMNSRKDETLELLNYAEQTYGASDDIKKLRERASKVTEKPDPVVDFYLQHAKPTAKEIAPYVGHWVGELRVHDGQNLPMDVEILVENGKGKMIEVMPWPPYEKVESEILFVDDKGRLVYGRKNRGAGLVISTGTIDKAGVLSGDEKLVGFTIPDDMPADIKERMKFIIANPNQFYLKKK